MRIIFQQNTLDAIQKAFGKRDLAKLRKEIITDKNGHRRTVWVKNDQAQSVKPQKKTAQDVQNMHSYAHTRGDHVIFMKDGQPLTGKIVDLGRDGVTVLGTGKAKGQSFKVLHSDIKQVTKMINTNDAIRGLMNQNGIKSGWRGTDGMQPEACDTIEGLYDTVEAARGEFSTFTDSVCQKFLALNPIVMKRDTLKSEKRIKEKLREDENSYKKGCEKTGAEYRPMNYDERTDTYHCRTIRDCDGHTICLNSIEDVANVLKHLDGMKEVARIKNNFGKPSPVGYSDINCNVKLSNGAIVELQVNTTANMVAKERYGHALYEVYRSVVSNPKYTKLADIMGKAQTDLYGLSNKYSKEGNFSTANIPKGRDGNANIFDGGYKHTPYADAIRDYVNSAIPLFNQAKAEGILNDDTIKHFEHLVEYIR
jgi:hypothetical protein